MRTETQTFHKTFTFAPNVLSSIIILSCLLLVCCLIWPVNRGQSFGIYIWVAIYFSYVCLNGIYGDKCIFSILCLFLLFTSPLLIFCHFIYLWYFPSILFVFQCSLRRTLKLNAFIFIISTYYLVMLVLFYLANQSSIGFLYGVKYYYAQIFMVFVLFGFIRLEYEFSISVILMIFGIILTFAIFQYTFNWIYGFHENPLNLYMYNVEMRPASTFSETTWVGECAVLAMLLSSYAYKIKVISIKYYVYFIIITSMSIFISNTRAAYLALGIILFLNIHYLNIRFLIKISFWMLLLIVLAYILFPNKFEYLIMGTIQKFHFKDMSAHGRFDAAILTFNGWFSSIPYLIFGHGFNWNANEAVAVSGSAIGAKSFSLILLIPYIFGIGGIVLLAYALIAVMIRLYFNSCRLLERVYGFSMLLSYLIISFVAPLFQYPLGILWLALSLVVIYHKF